ncbi:hypothetical protein NTD86_07870 [Pseudomonas sp. 7P_10.2_Bac1]|uniref:hypothetical protein n=1 Tax=Pseudomonas sp. 7P_10.2_Bac1 TaxID=2971614 RepID=UPI0021C59AFC|nr:hypothetical protein [Pseudomonas sp. 7P_10.2_Bac1]MCU1726903.1 hypothetical protein [Pseudomonas sp. 7P_10.2_Bac1]
MSRSSIAQLEEDTFLLILNWVEEVVEGKGASLAQMMVSTVLGLIPFVGQAVDAYNILRCLYHLSRTPDSREHWLDLVLSLIALVPGFGDALKNVCNMLRHDKPMGRILDSLPRHVRGDIETWFRTLDWARYTAEMIQNLDTILQGLITMLSRSLSSWALGRKGVQQLINQLSELQKIAGRKITEAMDTLKRAHQKALTDPLPSTTARTPAAPGAVKAPAPNSQASGNVAIPTAGTRLPAQGRVTAQQRQSERSSQRPHQISVSGEHITDYYFVKRQRRRSKVNHSGQLYEMSQPGHHGIDHVWHSGTLPLGYRISDTKGTGGAFHKLETAKAVFAGLEYGIDAYLGMDDEKRVERAVNKPTVGDGRQLSHKWVAAKIEGAGITESHYLRLTRGIKAWERVDFKLGAETQFAGGKATRQLVKCPYDRSLITVVGPNHNLHERAKGPVTPKCCKAAVSHQIGTEFVLPTQMLRE